MHILAALTAFGGLIVAMFALSVILAAPVMWLWDWLMPTIFGLKEITLIQAWGLTMLCSLLFKSNRSSD